VDAPVTCGEGEDETAAAGTVIDLLLMLEWKGIARVMAAEMGQRPPNLSVDVLLRKGQEILDSDPQRAHVYFREAALRDPYDERVWEHLLRTVDDPEDQRVCLQNIVAINPLNADARRRLRALETRKRAEEAEKRLIERRKQRGGRVFRQAVLAGMGIGLLATALAVFLAILMYGVEAIPKLPW
jgi:hypothetical protein